MADPPAGTDLQRGPRAGGTASLPYTGRPPGAEHVAPFLPQPVRRALDIPSLYRPDDGLVAAANVALTLRLPLLLSGRPGTGKTEMARSIAHTLHGAAEAESRLYRVNVTSTADKSDLLYRYDELARLRDAYEKSSDLGGRKYLRLRGLGQAIVAAGRPDDRLEPMVPGTPLPDGLATLIDLVGPPPPPGESDGRHAFFLTDTAPPVVLLDEIDKAPRELPNDLLTELDAMVFDIPELGVRVRLRQEERWPVVVITSNAERPLSEAFLRRCVCYEVDVPDSATLHDIVYSKLGAMGLLEGAPTLPGEVVDFVAELDQRRVLADAERPGIARILDFSVLLADPRRLGYASMSEIGEPTFRACLSALLPSRAAQATAVEVWKEWAFASPRAKQA